MPYKIDENTKKHHRFPLRIGLLSSPLFLTLLLFPQIQFLSLYCFYLSLTFRLLEAVAPLVVRKLAVLEGVTGVEERLHAQLVLVLVDGTQF